MANAKIVVTLGLATDAPETIQALIRAGARIFRLNTPHGPWAKHAERIRSVRCAEAVCDCPVAILLDLQGPKIRLGRFREGACTLDTGSTFVITIEDVIGDSYRACTTYPDLARDVKPGDRVLLNDGAVTLRARSRTATDIEFEVVSGGPVGDQKGINLPGVDVSPPSMTAKDVADLHAGLAAGVDFVALSFVRPPRT